MIHINTGIDSKKHEWVTKEEFEKRYPDLAKSLNEPIEEDKLRKIRIKKRITLREMVARTSLDPVTVSKIERGKIRDQTLRDKYIMVLNNG